MDDGATIKVIQGNILERIRQRPAMYLGKHSLTALYHFMSGYSLGQGECGVASSILIPREFHDWVAYRLHFLESTSGYADMILSRVPDEAKALDRFFQLLDEYSVRKPAPVARVRCHPPNFDKIKRQTKFTGVGLGEFATVVCAEEVSIVIFTDDPGFFLVNDDQARDYPERISFYPSLSWLCKPYKPDLEFTTVVNQEQFDRLRREALLFEQTHKERRERRGRTLNRRLN